MESVIRILRKALAILRTPGPTFYTVEPQRSLSHFTSSMVTSAEYGFPLTPGPSKGDGFPCNTPLSLQSSTSGILGDGYPELDTTEYPEGEIVVFQVASIFRNGAPQEIIVFARSIAMAELSTSGFVPTSPPIPPPTFAPVIEPEASSSAASEVTGSSGNSRPRCRRQKASTSSGVLGARRKLI